MSPSGCGNGRWALLALACLPLGCLGELENQPAYAAERFLCSSPERDEYDSRVDACRRDRAGGGRCGGIASLAGQLQGHELVVDAELTSTTFFAVTTASTGETLDRIDAVGLAPYFVLTLSLKSVGGPLAASSPPPRTLDFEEGSASTDANLAGLEDDRAWGALRIQSSRENINLPALPGSGPLDIELQDEDEVRGRIVAAFGSEDDRVEMCFHAFETARRSASP